MTFIVSIESKQDPGSPYYTVATDHQAEVEQLEKAAGHAGLDAVVRHADSVSSTLKWIREQ